MQLALALAHNPENNEKIIEVGLTPLRLPFLLFRSFIDGPASCTWSTNLSRPIPTPFDFLFYAPHAQQT